MTMCLAKHCKSCAPLPDGSSECNLHCSKFLLAWTELSLDWKSFTSQRMTAWQISSETTWSVNKTVHCMQGVFQTSTRPEVKHPQARHSISMSCEAAVVQLIPALRGRRGHWLIIMRRIGLNVGTQIVGMKSFFPNACKCNKNAECRWCGFRHHFAAV